MKFLTYNFLTSKCIRGVKVGFPLVIKVIYTKSHLFTRKSHLKIFFRLPIKRLKIKTSTQNSSVECCHDLTGRQWKWQPSRSALHRTCPKNSISKHPPMTLNSCKSFIISCWKSISSKVNFSVLKRAGFFRSRKEYRTCCWMKMKFK